MLLLLCLVLCCCQCQSFTSNTCVALGRLHHTNNSNKWRIHTSKDDDDNDKSISSADPEENSKSKTIVQQIGITLLETFGYTLQIASWLISAGLVLNIFGYGYRVSTDEGSGVPKVEFDTLRNMRQQNQLNAEFEKMARGSDLSSTQSRALLPKSTPMAIPEE